jgi:hypothetical protein
MSTTPSKVHAVVCSSRYPHAADVFRPHAFFAAKRAPNKSALEVGTDVIALCSLSSLRKKKEAAAWQKAATFLLNYVARHIVLLFSFRV